MSKRKIVAGGYDESSDGLEPELASAAEKRPKAAPYAPARLTTARGGALSSFQFPQPRSTSVPRRSPLVHDTPLPPHPADPSDYVLSPTQAPLDSQDTMATTGIVSSTSPPTVSVDQCSHTGADVKSVPSKLESTGFAVPKVTHMRQTLAFEKQFNELSECFSSYMASNDAQHTETHKKLDQLFDMVNCLISTEGTANGLAPSQFTQANSDTRDPSSMLANPPATPEIIEIIERVVSDARNRVGKKKGGPEENTKKEHTRNTWYGMLGISAAKEIPPHYEDEYGNADTLPIRFMDPETKYIKPYPHWKFALNKQVEWVMTFIFRFRVTIPKDRSKSSDMLRKLTDEEIIILLHDGPFKTAQTEWRNMNKTDEEIEAMRKYHQVYQRTERKAASRSKILQTISSLQGPEWEFLSHAGYMSSEESDDEVGRITVRPSYRAQWVTNVYKAIDIALLETSTPHSPLHQLSQPSVKIVQSSIPHLKRSIGNTKVVVRIAQCALSKSWRENNPGEMQKNGAYINPKVFKKPDISSFLAQHPLTVEYGVDHTGDTIGLQHPAVRDAILPGVVQDNSPPGGSNGGYSGRDHYGLNEAAALGFPDMVGNNQSGISNSQIDPALLSAHLSDKLFSNTQETSSSSLSVLPSNNTNPPLELTTLQDSFGLCNSAYNQMPSPPPLQPTLPQVAGSEPTPAPNDHTKPPPVKKRGRPVGSKNKKKKADDTE